MPDAAFEGGQVPAQDSVDVARGMREAVDHVELEPGAVEPDAGDPAALGAEVDGRDGCPGGSRWARRFRWFGGSGGHARRLTVGVWSGSTRSQVTPASAHSFRYAAGTPVSEIKAVIRSTGRKGWLPNRSTFVESKMP